MSSVSSFNLRVHGLLNRQAALDYIAAVGAVAEDSGHHPDLHLTSYRTVEVRLSTHAVGGITNNDLIVAAVWAERYTPSRSPRLLGRPTDAIAVGVAALRKSTRFQQRTALNSARRTRKLRLQGQSQHSSQLQVPRLLLQELVQSNSELEMVKYLNCALASAGSLATTTTTAGRQRVDSR